MRQTTGTRKSPGEKLVKDIKRATRKQYSSEEKIRIVLDGLRGEDSIAEALRDWIRDVGAKTAYIEPGSPWENGYCKSFNGRMRDELLNGEIFYSLRDAQIIIERWRNHYNIK